MKGFLVTCVLALSVFSAFAVDPVTKKKITETFKKCRESNPVTDAEVEMMKKHEVPNSPQAKCLMKCMLESGKILKDGKYSKAVAMSFSETIHSDSPADIVKAKEVGEYCISTIGSEPGNDLCEFAYNLFVCGEKKAKEIGLEMPTWE